MTSMLMGAADNDGSGLLMQFENALESEFIDKLNKFAFVINDINVGFANITFAYDNPELLRLLTMRGTLITSGKFDKVPAINKLLEKLKTENKDKITKPVTAFLTFNTQEGYERALKNWGPDSAKSFSEVTEHHKFCESQIKVTAAPEPSNIIWEHRHISDAVQTRNKICVGFAIFCILALAFVIFTFAKISVVRSQAKYPPTLDCTSIDNQFTSDQALFKQYAEVDKPYTDKAEGTGIY